VVQARQSISVVGEPGDDNQRQVGWTVVRCFFVKAPKRML
jgi:hypothetical protein